jgi:parvulin-like peptidyl-prolyl isomerase
MQRNLTIAFGLAVVALAVAMAIKSLPSRGAGATGAPDGGGLVDAGTDGTVALALDSAAEIPAAAADNAADDSLPMVDAGELRLADGTLVPPLGPKAPKHVRFGVVLVAYTGAEGASPKARSKSDALTLATKLALDAKGDFAGAVRNGDDGSATDVGVVDRNTLEPTSEAVLFALAVGGTSGVIDTPRGFWIVKRLE